MIQNLENEEWKDVIGYEGLYQVSNLGRVKSLDRIVTTKENKSWKLDEKLLKPHLGNNGYYAVALCKNGKVKRLSIHRLVASAFIDNPENLPCVNHKSENKLENTVENLEWCDYIYNNSYGTVLERRSNAQKGKKIPIELAEKLKEINRGNKYHNKAVNQYTLEMEFIKQWESIKTAADALGFNRRNISLVCKNKRPTSNGFKWGYA